MEVGIRDEKILIVSFTVCIHVIVETVPYICMNYVHSFKNLSSYSKSIVYCCFIGTIFLT